jgi:hypothetical protein
MLNQPDIGSVVSAHFQTRHAPISSLDTDARSYTRKSQDRRTTKARLVELLFAAGSAEAAKKVASCNSKYFGLACSNGHSAQILPTFRCRNRLCPYCASERQRRTFSKLWPILKSYAQSDRGERVVLITLTFRNSFEQLAVQDKHFKAAFRRLRRMKRWRDRISGALCGYEFTVTPTGWHYHAHILSSRKAWYDQTELADDWQKAARGRGEIVDIRAVSDLSYGLRDLLQYCFKPLDLEMWTAADVQQFEAMRRIKLSECFGELRGLKIEADEIDNYTVNRLFVGYPCPECGERLERVKVSWRNLDKYAPISKDWFIKARASPIPMFLRPIQCERGI